MSEHDEASAIIAVSCAMATRIGKRFIVDPEKLKRFREYQETRSIAALDELRKPVDEVRE